MSPFADPQFLGHLGTAFHDHDSEVERKQREAENVRRVEQLLATFVNGNFDALHELLDDDVEMEIMGPEEALMMGRHRGRPAVIEALRHNFSQLEDQQPTLEAVVAQGDQVVLVGRDRGRLRTTGRTYDVPLVQMYTFRNGKIVSMRELADTASWIRATGAQG